jgi:hypothetical protein
MSQTPNQTQTQTTSKPKVIELAKKVLAELDEKTRNGDAVAFNSMLLVKEFVDNVERTAGNLKIKDALNVYVWKLLPRTVRILISIKQHLSDLYRNGYHIKIITSPDCHEVETPKSSVQFLKQYNEIYVEFNRTRITKKVELTLDDNNVAKEVFEMIGRSLIAFKHDAIDYKLISLIVKHTVNESSYSVMYYD